MKTSTTMKTILEIRDGRDGRELLPFTYDSINSLQFDRIIVEKDGKFGVIDDSGEVLVPLIYDKIYSYIKDKTVVVLDGKFGVIDDSGEVLVPLIYDKIYHSEFGFVTMQDNLYGFAAIDLAAQIDPVFEWMGGPTKNAIPFMNQWGLFGIIDTDCSIIVEPKFTFMSECVGRRVFAKKGQREFTIDICNNGDTFINDVWE